MKTTLAMIAGLAALTAADSAQAHLSFYDCDAVRDICASDGTCERHSFDMDFAVNDLAGSAAIIQGANYTVLTPVYGAGAGLQFEHMGQRYQFQLDPFGSLQVTTTLAVNGQPSTTTFLCAGEF